MTKFPRHVLSALAGLLLCLQLPVSQAAPEIELWVTDRSELVWSPAGSGRWNWNPLKGSGPYWFGRFYKAVYPGGLGFQELVRFGQNGSNTPTAMVVAVDLSGTALRNPIDYEYMWDDWDSGADLDASFWRPIPPAGYRCLGDMPQLGRSKPPLDAMACVRQDLVVPGEVDKDEEDSKSFVWNSRDACRNSGSCTDAFSAFRITPKPGTEGIEVKGAVVGSRGFFDGRDYAEGVYSYDDDDVLTAARSSHGFSSDHLGNYLNDVWVLKGSAVDWGTPPEQWELEQLISYFGPEIRMHVDEEFFPDDPEAMFDDPGTVLRYGITENYLGDDEENEFGFLNFNFNSDTNSNPNSTSAPAGGNIPTSNATILHDMQVPLAHPRANDDDFVAYLDYPQSTWVGNTDRARAYVRAQPLDGAFLELQYWIFYPYNSDGKLRLTVGEPPQANFYELKTILGRHWSDWENVRVRLAKRSVWNGGEYRGYTRNNLVLSKHASEEEISNFDPRLGYNEHFRPIVYSAKGSHAQYPTSDVHYYQREKSFNYAIGTFAVDLLDLTGSADLVGGFDPTGFGGGGLGFANDLGLPGAEEISDYAPIQSDTARIGMLEFPSFGSSEKLRTYLPGKSVLVSAAWPNVTPDVPNWFYFMDQFGGFIPSKYAGVRIFNQSIETKFKTETGKPGLMERNEWHEPVPINPNLGMLITNEGDISPAFDQGVTEYSIAVDNTTTTFQLAALAVDDQAKIEIKQGATVLDTLAWDAGANAVHKELLGKYSIPIGPLSAGLNVYDIVVTICGAGTKVQTDLNCDPVTKTYQLTVDRAAYTVQNTNPSGPGSLVAGLAIAQDGDAIRFNASLDGQTINLNDPGGSSHFVINGNKDIRIDASNLPNRISINANNHARHFFIDSGSKLILRNVTLFSGYPGASSGGGAIQNLGTLEVWDSRIVSNEAGSTGGGIQNVMSGSDYALILRTRIAGNIAGTSGGGIFNSSSGNGPQLFQSTVRNNSAPIGGALHNAAGTTTLYNSTVANNTTDNGSSMGLVDEGDGFFLNYATVNEGLQNPNDDPTGTTLRNSILFEIDSDYDTIGENIIGARSNASDRVPGAPFPYFEQIPQLTPLGDYGGPTWTMLPGPNSYANDNAVPFSLMTDQKGDPRGATPDIGSVEAPNLNLPYLDLSDGVLSPALDGSDTVYNIPVAYDIHDISFGTAPPLAGTTVSSRVNGGTYGDVTTPLLLNLGLNVVEIQVDFFGVFQDVYTINITRAAPSTNADLHFLAASSMDLDPVFDSAVTSYDAGTVSGEDFRLWTKRQHWASKVEIRVNGGNYSEVPDITPIAAGGSHGLRLSEDGDVIGTGFNFSGQAQSQDANYAENGFVKLSAGLAHSVAIDGGANLRAWGQNNQSQTDYPSGLHRVTQVASETHNLALTRDGTVVAWGGSNSQGELDVPPGLTDVIQVAAGSSFSLALKSDGTVVQWGSNTYPVPGGLSDVVAIVASSSNSLALKADGTVVRWGFELNNNLSDVPGNLVGVVDIAAGGSASFALTGNGRVTAWGLQNQCEATAFVSPLEDVIDIASGSGTRTALKQDGFTDLWGAYGKGQIDDPNDAIKSPTDTVPAIALVNGLNTIDVRVMAQDGTTTKTYTVTVTRDDTFIADQFELAPDTVEDIRLENDVYYDNITQIGQIIYFRVTGSTLPEFNGRVDAWGTGVYQLRSNIANAAVHAGVLADGEEGVVAITIVPPPPGSNYTSSIQNGVETRGGTNSRKTAFTIAPFTGDPYASLKTDYGVRRGLTPIDLRCYGGNEDVTMRFLVLASAPDDPNNPASEQTVYFQKFEDEEDVNGQVITENAFEVNRYSSDSSLATAVVHAGILQDGEVGLVDVTYEAPFDFDDDDIAIDTVLQNGVKPSLFGGDHDGKTTGGYRLEGVALLSGFLPVLSANADLESLLVSEGTFAPLFTANTLNYTVTREDEFRQLVNITPTAADPLAKIEFTVDDDPFFETPTGEASLPFYLPNGSSVIKVRVTSPDGSTTKTYNLTVNFTPLATIIDTDEDTIFDSVDNCIFDPNTDQLDTDNDLIGNVCDDDDDNDGVEDTFPDNDPLNPNICRDLDGDSCDDCSVGTDGFGPLDDFDDFNDGLDTDGNGICNVTDPDDDDDGDLDGDDNCPLVFNPGQEDSDNDGTGDACEVTQSGDICFPVKTQTTVTLVCM
ncbi:MAG: Vps62-related protein [Pseudomonadota bacterium]